MKIDISGDGLQLLQQFIHCTYAHPVRIADAMWFDRDDFIRSARCLTEAYHNAQADMKREKRPDSKKIQSPLPDDFDRRFPGPSGEKIREWLDYKTERRDFYSPTGLRNLLTQIDNRLKNHSVELVIDLISECMANNWAGIIWSKIEQRNIRPYGQRDRYLKSRIPSPSGSPWYGFFDDCKESG
jgi:hypothetical protein